MNIDILCSQPVIENVVIPVLGPILKKSNLKATGG